MPSLPSLQDRLARVRASGELALPLPGAGRHTASSPCLERLGGGGLVVGPDSRGAYDALAILAEPADRHGLRKFTGYGRRTDRQAD